MATTLVLARHGETDWNREGRIQGHLDPPLNERGRSQARALAARLDGEPFDAVYASDLRRALETAEIVSQHRGLRVAVDPELREADMGSWSGLTASDIQERFPAAWRERITGGQGHDGESREDFHQRVARALARIADAHPDGRVLAVCHGGVIRTVLRQLEPDAVPALIENCGVLRIDVQDGVMRRVD